MAVFNVSFLNPKTRAKAGGVNPSILADQLVILEQELGKDGYLSPGDYDILINKARDIQTSSGLSAAQQSDYDVRISRFEAAKQTSSQDRTEDINKSNMTLKSEAAEDVMVVGNNPAEFLRGRVASYQSKLNDLQEAIQRRAGSLQDTIEYENEYQATMSEYQQKFSALAAMENFDGNNPIQGHVAYVTTNSRGEIVDVDYSKHGSKSGYSETNGMIDGFQVYGKTNYKRDGKNFFIMGDNMFQAPDMMIPDPENPGSFKPNKMVANVSQQGPFTVGESGYLAIPGKSVGIQGYIPPNSWAKGVGGTVYNRRDDGGYTKYININQSMPDMPPTDSMLTIPDKFEQNLMSNVDETIDPSVQIAPNDGLNYTPMDPAAMEGSGVQVPAGQSELVPPSAPMSTEAPAQGQGGPTTRRTPQQPKNRASNSVGSTIQRTIQSGANAFKSLFS